MALFGGRSYDKEEVVDNPKYKKDETVAYGGDRAVITCEPVLFGNFYIYDIVLPDAGKLELFGIWEEELIKIQ